MKSIHSNYKVITTHLLNTTVLEHLEVRLTDAPTSELINAIGQNKSIKALKLFYCVDDEEIECTISNWDAELAQYIQNSTSLEQLNISGKISCLPSKFIKLLSDSLAINTSIKSMIYGLAENMGCIVSISMYLNDAYNLIDKLKENNTLKELTLNEVLTYMDNEPFSEIEKCVQQINNMRTTRGIANLK